MAEGARLESVLTGNRYVGSNPTLSVWVDLLRLLRLLRLGSQDRWPSG